MDNVDYIPLAPDAAELDAVESVAGEPVAGTGEQLPTEPVELDPVSDPAWELEGIEVYAMPPITSSTGLKGLLYEVIGPYDTIITQFTYKQNGNNYYSYVNDISPDYPWLMSAALFVVLIFCVFRTLGGLLAWKK